MNILGKLKKIFQRFANDFVQLIIYEKFDLSASEKQ